MVRKAFIALTFVASPIAAQDVPELLVCRGSAVGQIPDGQDSVVLTDNSGNVVTGSSRSTRTAQVDMTVQFRLQGDDPRANLPRIAAPQIASSKGGWYRVKDLEVSDTHIRGKVVFNVFNSSRFEIDRRTAILTSEAGFQGSCEAVTIGKNAF